MSRPKPERSVPPPTEEYPNPFPSYDDLARYLVQTGEVDHVDEILDQRLGVLGDLVLDWIARGQHACQFAKRVAKRLEQPQWLPIVIPHTIGPALPHMLESVLPAAEAESEAVLLIFPGVVSAPELVQLLNWLCEHPDWYWEEIEWEEEDEEDARILVGLRWRLPDREHVSWALGFGPLASFPYTRRIMGAPFTVIALRNKWPATNDHPNFGDSSGENVHLAHMPLALPDDETIALYCRRTKDLRRTFLSKEPPGVAKARITFAIPAEQRAALCAPS